MAKRFPLNKKHVVSLLWLGLSGILLLSLLVIISLLIFSGSSNREKALHDAKRIEFSPVTGEVEGKIIRMAEIDPSHATPAPAEPAPAEPAPPPAAEETPPPAIEPVPAVTEVSPPVPATPAETPSQPETPPEPKISAEHSTQATAAPVEPVAETPRTAAPPPPASSTPPDAVEQKTDAGIIPLTTADGKMAWQFYKKPSAATKSPRIAIVLYGLGLGSLATEAALALPAPVTLSFSPYSREVAGWAQKARSDGHEILLDLPMETDSYPAMDPGPYGQLIALPAAENYTRLTTILSRARGYVGLLSPLHERFTNDSNGAKGLIEALNKHGLLLVSSQPEAALPLATASQQARVPLLNADMVLDQRITESYIQGQLAQLEELAKKQGYALAIGRSFPVTVELVAAWATTLQQKGITLVPVTALTSSASQE